MSFTTRVRDRIRKALESDEQRDNQQLERLSAVSGSQLLSSCSDRAQVTVRGQVRWTAQHPSMRAFCVEVYDGSDAVILVLMGRTHVDALHPGVCVVAHGRLGIRKADGTRTMYNPRFEVSTES